MTLVISKGLTLDNGTRAAAIAGVSPTLDYRFAREKREIETVSLTDKLTYTGGNGTFVGSDGFIQRATTNVPRFDHDPLSRQSLGLLSEGERTNNYVGSENLSGLSVSAASIASSAVVTPSNNTNAIELVEDATNAQHSTSIIVPLTSGTAASVSIFVKAGAGSRNLVIRGLGAQFGVVFDTRFDIAAGTVAAGNGSIQRFANGWLRCTFTNTPTVTTAAAGIRLHLADGASISYQGDGISSLLIYGPQAENGAFPSTYIPTTSAAVTRTADSAVIDGTGVLTGTYTMVEKPAGCAVVSGSNIELQPGFTAERVMVFPAALDAGQITAIRGAM